MLDNAGICADYMAAFGGSHGGRVIELPPLLTLPLKARVDAHAGGRLDLELWHREERQWSDWADRRYRACAFRQVRDRSPVVRIGIKDTIDVAGMPTRLGLRHYRHYPHQSASVLDCLDPNLIVAKVVTTELNLGVGSGCINPYSPHITPAGSSTGAAVAVAANICDVCLGTDVLGSVRWPAGNCGVVGLRMTHDPGRLRGMLPLAPSMDALGWVARHARDLAYLWPSLAPDGTAEADDAQQRRCRIGVVSNVTEGCDPAMLAALADACRQLEGCGHLLQPLHLNDLWAARGAAWELCARQAWDSYQQWKDLFDGPELLESTRNALELGAQVEDARHRRNLDRLATCRHNAVASFDQDGLDAWLLPLHPAPPREVGARRAGNSTIPSPADADYEQRIGYTPLASIGGLPAITVPVARHRVNGAPLSVQLIARRGAERQLILLAVQLEEAIGDLGFRPS